MRTRGVAAVMLALLGAPIAAEASDITASHPKLPEAIIAAPLLPKHAAPETRLGYGCMIGQTGGVALSFLLGSGRAWDYLADAVLGDRPSAELRAACALGEALAAHLSSGTESIAQEASAFAQRHAETTQETMAASSALLEKSWAGLRDAMADRWARLWGSR